MGLPSIEKCTDRVEIGVAVCGAADGLCGLGVVPLIRLWEGAAEELDTAASAMSVDTLSAARQACSLGGRLVGICVLSVPGLFGRRWASAMGDPCRRCLPPDLSRLFLASSRKVIRRTAEGGV